MIWIKICRSNINFVKNEFWWQSENLDFNKEIYGEKNSDLVFR